jgi:hypothetical protein
MRKISIFFIIASIFILSSCSKQLTNQKSLINSVNAPNLKTDGTGVTLSDAQLFAQRFLQKKNPNANVIIINAQTIVKNGIPYFHIINANKGFVILSPDSLYMPILAYDSIGNFSFSDKNLNAGLVSWLNKHAHELDFIRNNKSVYVDSIGSVNKKLWGAVGRSFNKEVSYLSKINGSIKGIMQNHPVVNTQYPVFLYSYPVVRYSDNTIGPLCSTIWNQIYPFNEYCPNVNNPTNGYNGLAAAGCVPVAMAQIMYFWNYPQTYNWPIMYLSKAIFDATPGSRPGVDEMARLIHDIGTTSGPVFINATSLFSTSQFAYYQLTETSADDTYCPYVFNQFGYTSASRTESVSDQILSGAKNGTSYADLLTNEIQYNKRPCMVAGYIGEQTVLGLVYWPNTTGHEWVCDGSYMGSYETGTTSVYSLPGSKDGETFEITNWDGAYIHSMLHMNWGWGGMDENDQPLNNGWYNCSINYSQPNAGNHDFGYFQTIIYNIHP